MKRLLWLAPLALFALAQWGTSGPAVNFKSRTLALPGFKSWTVTFPFKAGERALVIASGDGSSPLALYVYDAHGNCVSMDEGRYSATPDDLAVEWFPPEPGEYTLELRNTGHGTNKVNVIVR